MTAATAVVVLQARVASTRLPGKVLLDVHGYSVLERCVIRLLAADCGPVVVATTRLPADDAVERAAAALDVPCVRGATDDVLSRFALAARDWAGGYVIRATADNPLVDVQACVRTLEHLRAGADYVVEASLPVGAAVEGMTTDSLRQADREAQTAYDREHVTPWIRARERRFRVPLVVSPAALSRSDLRLTVDTEADLVHVRSIVGLAGADPLTPLSDYIRAADTLAAARLCESPCSGSVREAS